MKEKEKKNTIVKRMIFAVAAGFVVGFLMLFLREFLLESGKSGIWKTVDAIFFQDVTKTNGIEGIGILYIVGQLFMRGLQLAIVPLVLTSLSLAMCSLANPERLGKIAGKTFITYICFYVVAAALAGAAAYFVKTMGWFDVQLPNEMVTEAVTMEGYNPLVTVVNAVPSNIFSAFSSNNEIISVVVVAIILGLCMTVLGKKTEPLRKVIENLNDVVQLFLNFLIDKIGPVAIFCMITRTLAVYGIEYIKPTLVWIVTTIVVSLVLVFTIYPVGIFLTTPAESDSVCEENVEDRLVCGSDKLFCGNTSAEYKDMYGRTGMFKRNQQFCSSYRYDDQHERYDSDAYDCDYIYCDSGRN